MNYARAIRICRAALEREQADVARTAGISASHLSLIEGGKRRPSLVTLEALCKSLRVPLHVVMLLAADARDVKTGRARELNQLADELLKVLATTRKPKG